LFALGAFTFETREIRWSGELIFALAWLVLVLSIAAVGLTYWLIRRSAATGFASLFYLVPAVTALFAFILFANDWTQYRFSAWWSTLAEWCLLSLLHSFRGSAIAP